jgi:hypothetical protein
MEMPTNSPEAQPQGGELLPCPLCNQPLEVMLNGRAVCRNAGSRQSLHDGCLLWLENAQLHVETWQALHTRVRADADIDAALHTAKEICANVRWGERSLKEIINEIAMIIFRNTTCADLPRATAETFQARVHPWLQECFGPQIAADTVERNHRFLEESLELVQALGCTESEALQLVDYVFNRDRGTPSQEVGGVMVTLAALCLANGLDMHGSAESELARIWTKVETIRAKQAAKPPHSPLPATPRATGETTVEAALDERKQVRSVLDMLRRGPKTTACWCTGGFHSPPQHSVACKAAHRLYAHVSETVAQVRATRTEGEGESND